MNYVLGADRPKDQGLLCANGCRDTTRIATSDAAMWSAIARANRDELLEAMDAFTSTWEQLRAAVAGSDGQTLAKIMERGARLRRRLDKP